MSGAGGQVRLLDDAEQRLPVPEFAGGGGVDGGGDVWGAVGLGPIGPPLGTVILGVLLRVWGDGSHYDRGSR